MYYDRGKINGEIGEKGKKKKKEKGITGEKIRSYEEGEGKLKGENVLYR